MIYSFHHYAYWVKGGIESGMAYRAKIFRELGLDAKFVFATTFPNDNIQHETDFLGFLDSEIIWLYSFFTDCRISPVTYTLKQLESSFGTTKFMFSRKGISARYTFPEQGYYYAVVMADDESDLVHRVCVISKGCLIRQDCYTYCRIYSEYYISVNGQAKIYLRRFFNENGSIAYEEMINGDEILYRLPDRILYSREELLGYMMSQLNFTEQDVVLIDGEAGIIELSAFIENAFPAKIGFVIHLEHYWNSDSEHVLWSPFYEYALNHPEKIAFYVTNTETQSGLLREQFRKYTGVEPRVVTIPVVGIDELKTHENHRRKHALISAGRLAEEKHMDWVIEAVAEAKKSIPDISVDIYGEGEEKIKLQEQIVRLNCEESIHLKGFQKLDDVYQKYEAYVSATRFETFGVTLLEAVGAGLPIIGFDVHYGVQNFIDDGRNGYKISYGDIKGLTDAIVSLFTETDMELFRKHSYEKAEEYLTERVKRKWKDTLEQIR